jgi:hypothetical protein
MGRRMDTHAMHSTRVGAATCYQALPQRTNAMHQHHMHTLFGKVRICLAGASQPGTSNTVPMQCAACFASHPSSFSHAHEQEACRAPEAAHIGGEKETTGGGWAAAAAGDTVRFANTVQWCYCYCYSAAKQTLSCKTAGTCTHTMR